MTGDYDLQPDHCPCCQQVEIEIPEESTDDTTKKPDVVFAFPVHESLQRKLSPSSIFVNEEENPKERAIWIGKVEFMMSCMGYSVGLGNIWRFPYLAYKNGGATFLIPYLLMLIFVGWPLVFLEMAVGQYSSKGSIAVWQACPIFEGIGYAMMIVSLLITLYFAVLIGWALFFLFDSFRDSVSFQYCNHTWNTEHCYRKEDIAECTAVNITNLFYNQTCFNETEASVYNISRELINQTHKVLPSEEYFKYQVLGLSDGIGHWGEMRWENTLCLATAWCLIIICLLKGIKTSGKIVYFTATFPYLVLSAFLIRGLMLEGSIEGIRYYLSPDFKRLADPNVWIDAAGQALFSLGVAFGGLITLSSYNKFENNCLRDAITVFLIDAATSFLSGCVTFAILGFLAHETGHSIKDCIQAGSGIAFVIYPEAILRIPWSSFWSVIVFLMLATIGADSSVSMLETTVTALTEKYTALQSYRRGILLGLCLILFLVGLPLCTNAGLYWFTLLNDYAATSTVLLIALIENIAIISVYGINQLCEDIEMMIGRNPFRKVSFYWRFCWTITVPGLITGVLVFYWASYIRTPGEPAFPLWAEILGWLTALITVSAIPIIIILKLFQTNNKSSFAQKLSILCWPTENWGPSDMTAVPIFQISTFPKQATITDFEMQPRNHSHYNNSQLSMDEHATARRMSGDSFISC